MLSAADGITARWVSPTELGWVHVAGNVWKLPDGRLYEFAPRVKHEVAVCDGLWHEGFAPLAKVTT